MRSAVTSWILFSACFFSFFQNAPVAAEIVTESVEYRDGDATLKGYLAYDDAIEEKRPGVLVIHEWWGLNDYPKLRARQLAEMGYVAFAADMYGEGQVTTSREEAASLAGKVRGTPLMRSRAKAGYDVLAGHKLVDEKRIGAIGFCFGGSGVLELAYTGTDLAGVVPFHGSLPLPKDGEAERVKGKILVLHGTEDRAAPMPAVVEFVEAMRKGNVDYEIDLYGGTVHAFTNPAAGNDPSRGAAYNDQSANRSWKRMQDFFKELFGE